MSVPLHASYPARAAARTESSFGGDTRPRRWRPIRFAVAVAGALVLLADVAPALAGDDLPAYLRDRGRGIQTSLFGTYVEKNQLLVYAFYEPTFSANHEYKPAELGYSLEQDFRGKLTEHEALVFLSYGLSDRVAFEFESALYSTATQQKASDDPSALPDRLTESGLGDTQAEIRWRWVDETARRPELFSYFETVFPLQKNRKLIGTPEWELILGAGVIKGTPWGTLSARASGVYLTDGSVETDELSLEYLKRLSPSWRWVASVEGNQDEWSAIGEAQWFVRPRTFVKLNGAVGLTDKAPDFAPELGVMFSF